VFCIDSRTVLVSAAGSDAVLWVDLERGRVNKRWRLPEKLYGKNYDLTEEMSVQDHYIYNDIQLGHLNCAYPDSHGGCLISTLGQGDIGHVTAQGGYRLVTSGFVGCHGVRRASDGKGFYFSDSCDGRLVVSNDSGETKELLRVDSRWLHDAEQVQDDVYIFSLGDRNELSVIDVSRGIELGRFSFESRGANVQFLNVSQRG
jgi:hypothetical protein